MLNALHTKDYKWTDGQSYKKYQRPQTHDIMTSMKCTDS